MQKIEYFDYLKVANELKMPNNVLAELIHDIKLEFPKDKMMFELHVLRAIKSMFWKKGETSQTPHRKRHLELAH